MEMDREHLPEVDFTKEELTFLQDLMNRSRAEWFNYYEEKLEEGSFKSNEAYKKYQLCRSIRNKLYHMNGRDTLAPGNHEQRWWDQQHGYK